MRIVNPSASGRSRGIAFVYLALSMIPLIGFCSLAVDVGRYEICKTEMRRACIAAAHTGAANIVNGGTPAKTAAKAMAALNQVDGYAISGNKFTITTKFVKWNSVGNYQVIGSANNANGMIVTIDYTVPLMFAQVIGMPSKDLEEESVAVIQTTTTTQFVSAQSDPWLAGEPIGTRGSQPDPGFVSLGANSEHPWNYDYAGTVGGTANGSNAAPNHEPYSSPPQSTINVIPGASIQILSATGTASNDFTYALSNYSDATGLTNGSYNSYSDAAANGVAEHGMSDAKMPINSLTAVFLSNTLPDNITTPPPALDFSTQAVRDYSTIQPKLQQVIYAGNGQTSTSAQQTIVVPQGATKMYLGTMDGWEWDNNAGGYTVTIQQTVIATVE